MKLISKLILLSLFFCSSALANDSIGSVGAGGIEFIKSSSIKMVSEELTISPTNIKVNYLFKNMSNKPVSATIYFPLPPYEYRNGNTASWDEEVEGTNNNDLKRMNEHAPFRNFSVIVDGKPVVCQIKSRALLNGKDITDTLTHAGIPLNVDIAADGNAGDPEAEEDFAGDENAQAKYNQWHEKAQQLGLLDTKGKPRWQKQILYYWNQTFPAGQTIAISHEYKPATGSFLGSFSDSSQFNNDLKNFNEEIEDNLLTYDNHKQLMGRIAEINAKTNDYTQVFIVKYILRTGANWAGPIDRFTLNLLYPSDSAVAYNHFYNGQNAKVVQAPGKTQILLNNFIPSKDLNLLFAMTSESSKFADNL